MQSLRYIYSLLLAAVLPAFLCAQTNDDDRYVRLMSAQSVSSYEEDGKTFRKAEGPARFLHNDTWLICDTAIWDVDLQVIYALGNVSIEQENTELRSDKLTYYVERNLAEFRGTLVELVDKDQNTLRTRNLDYNTKDSVAIFHYGAAMRDKDGQIIESIDGEYDSKLELFTFRNTVNMFSDSVFVKTTALLYDSKESVASFPNYVDAWNEDRMMSGQRGHYDNKNYIFRFYDDVHTMNSTQEGWCDSLYFYREKKHLTLFGNSQLTDTSRAVTGLAGYIHYRDSLSHITMLDDPLLFTVMDQKDSMGIVKKDSVYVRADTLMYWSIMRKDIDSVQVALALERVRELSSDPVENMRAKAREAEQERVRAALEEQENEGHAHAGRGKGSKGLLTDADVDVPDPDDEAQNPADSVSVLTAADSLAMVRAQEVKDSLDKAARLAVDTLKIGHIYANGSVKVFRESMQMKCDSLVYSELDSLARLFKAPVIWNGPRQQYNADSVFVLVHNNSMERANLLSNAFIQVEETADKHYDQIKATEMTAFFDAEGQLRRFDALGGANALFYLRENDAISLANRSEATMLSATFVDGELNGISYYENPASDVHPVAQMKADQKYLKGFSWNPKDRPRSVADLSARRPRGTQRGEYDAHVRPDFVQTGIYFAGYMDGIYRQIEISDSLKRVRQEQKRLRDMEKERLKAAAADSLKAVSDSSAVSDSLAAVTGAAPSKPALDSLVRKTPKDSLNVGASPVLPDSLGVRDSLAAGDSLGIVSNIADTLVSPKDLKAALRAQKAAEREARRQAAIARREERWNRKDALDALKQAAKDAKKRQKKEAKLNKQIARLEKEKAREEAMLERYKAKYLKKSL